MGPGSREPGRGQWKPAWAVGGTIRRLRRMGGGFGVSVKSWGALQVVVLRHASYVARLARRAGGTWRVNRRVSGHHPEWRVPSSPVTSSSWAPRWSSWLSRWGHRHCRRPTAGERLEGCSCGSHRATSGSCASWSAMPSAVPGRSPGSTSARAGCRRLAVQPAQLGGGCLPAAPDGQTFSGLRPRRPAGAQPWPALGSALGRTAAPPEPCPEARGPVALLPARRGVPADRNAGLVSAVLAGHRRQSAPACAWRRGQEGGAASGRAAPTRTCGWPWSIRRCSFLAAAALRWRGSLSVCLGVGASASIAAWSWRYRSRLARTTQVAWRTLRRRNRLGVVAVGQVGPPRRRKTLPGTVVVALAGPGQVYASNRTGGQLRPGVVSVNLLGRGLSRYKPRNPRGQGLDRGWCGWFASSFWNLPRSLLSWSSSAGLHRCLWRALPGLLVTGSTVRQARQLWRQFIFHARSLPGRCCRGRRPPACCRCPLWRTLRVWLVKPVAPSAPGERWR